MPPGSRSVLLKTLARNIDDRTPSGIWKISETDTDWDPASHVDRWGEVIACPDGPLPFSFFDDIMPWETQIQIAPGMIVFYDYLQGLNASMYVDEYGSEYKLIDYDNLYVATFPKGEGDDLDFQTSTDGTEYIIPLNGFHIIEMVYKKKRGTLDYFEDKKFDKTKGIVKYVAQNNTAYENNRDEDPFDLQRGDVVQFGLIPPVTLEAEAHCVFDGGRMYRRSQGRNMQLIWRDGELILPKGKILISQLADETITPSGIVLPKAQVKNHRGKVILSSSPDINVDDQVSYVKGSGMLIDHEGAKCRVLTESQVLYIVS